MARRRASQVVLARRGEFAVLRDPRRPSGRLLRQDGMDASYVDLADPAHLEFDYTRWLQSVLLAARTTTNLHIGGGGCALPRALAFGQPTGLQLVCESEPEVLALAREHLGLRRMPGLRVRTAEGRRFLAAQSDGSFDAVVVDAFVGAAAAPALITREAFLDMARVAPLSLVNVVDDRMGRVVQAVASGLASAYNPVWLIGGRGGNTIVIGGGLTRPASDRIRTELAGDPAPARLTRWSGGRL